MVWEADDVLEGGLDLVSEGDADDVLEGGADLEIHGEPLDVLDVVTEPVDVPDFAEVVLAQEVADCVLEDVVESVLCWLAELVLEPVTVFVEVIVAVVVFVDVEDAVISPVKREDLDIVVVFVDVLEGVVDSVGSIPRFLWCGVFKTR